MSGSGLQRSSRNSRGMMLVFVVIGLIFVAFLIAFYSSTSVRQQARLTGTFIDGVVALGIAEAGVDQALFYLKKEKATNLRLRQALDRGERVELVFPERFYKELKVLAPPDGKIDSKVIASYHPATSQEMAELDRSKVRLGRLEIQSQGLYTNPQGQLVKKQVRVLSKVLGTNMLVVAPEHGYFSRDPRLQFYHVPSAALDARDFAVRGGKVYVENGMDVELTEYLMNKEFRPMREVGFLDLGYDSFNFFTLFNGGVNFTHSKEIGFHKNGVLKRYFKFQGFDAVLGPAPAWLPITEAYRLGPIVRQLASPPSDESIHLYRAEEYKRMATVTIEPKTPTNPEGNKYDQRFFTNVFFPGPLNVRNTVYRDVLPMYGWGDWRRVPPWVALNPSRRHDVSNAVQVDGVVYVKGDVFLEGWYHGVGTLVVQGNVYLGGKVIGLPPQLTGGPSLMNIVALEDPAREQFGNDIYNKTTGRVIYKPHHDQDWDRLNLKVTRELRPYFDGAIYAKNGVEVDKTSILDQFFDFEIEFNLATGLFDWLRLPNDIQINGTDPYDILFGRDSESRERRGFNPSFAIDIQSWQEERPSL